MSLGVAFNDDALRSFREIDIWLQEETLDDLEELGQHPERLRPRLDLSTSVYDLVRRRDKRVDYVFLIVDRDDEAGVLRILRLGHVVRSAE